MNPADIGWLLVSSALVLLMTPGLALFYGGMVRTRHVLNMLMMNLAAIPIVTILWVAITYSLMLDEGGNGVVGGLGSVLQLGFEPVAHQLQRLDQTRPALARLDDGIHETAVGRSVRIRK